MIKIVMKPIIRSKIKYTKTVANNQRRELGQ